MKKSIISIILPVLFLGMWVFCVTPAFAQDFVHADTFVEHRGLVRALAFSPDGQILASAGADTLIHLWNPTTGTLLRSLRGHTKTVTSVAFSPDGRLLASSSVDGSIRLWNPQTGREVRRISDAPPGGVQSVDFSADGGLLASGGRDNTVRLWDPQTGRLVRILSGHTDWVLGVAFSQTGLLATTSRDRKIKIWDANGRFLRDLTGHTDYVTSVAFAPTGELVSTSRDRTVRTWNPETGRQLRVLRRHTHFVNTVAVSASGRIASGSATLRLWDLAGQHLEALEVPADGIRAVVFSPDGSLLVHGDESGNVVLWQRGATSPEVSVRIPDPNLRAAIEDALGKTSGARITEVDMRRLTKLDAGKRGIQDLTGLEFAINLTVLNLSFNEISDVSPLANLKDITRLLLYVNDISDISSLAGLKNLTYMDLSANDISDVSSLAGLKNLTSLNLDSNDVSDVSPLVGLKNLTYLNLASNDISDVSPLAGLRKLRVLYLSNNQVSDFSPIAGLIPNLTDYDNSNQRAREEVMDDDFPPPEANGMDDDFPPPEANGMDDDFPPPEANGMDDDFPPPEANGMDDDFTPIIVDEITPSDDFTPRFVVVVDPTTLPPVDPPLPPGAPTTPSLNFLYTTTLKHIRAVRALAFSPNGSLLATADGPPPPNTGFPNLNVWNTVTNKRVMAVRTPLHRQSITSVEFSPDGRVLASASADGNICAWDPRTGQMLWFIRNAHKDGVQSISFSKNSRLLVSGGRDNTVRLWNVASQKLINTLERHTDWVLEVAISKDNVIASASRDHTIHLWNVRGKHLDSLQGHTDFVTSVGFAPTGEIVSASRDMTIRLWHPQTGAPLRIFRGHTGHVHQVAVHNPMIASPSADGTVRLWSLLEGEEFQAFTEHTDIVRIAAFSPNGLLLASGDESGNVVLWRDTPPIPPPETPPTGTLRPAKLTVPHSIELVEDNPVVENGYPYTPVFVVRNADGEPLEGVEVKLRLGQWVFKPVRTTQIPIPDELEYGRRLEFLRDDNPAPLRDEVNVYGWRVQSDPSPSIATTDSKGEAVFSRRLFSEGKYGVSATVLQNGQEFLTTSFSTTSTPNKEYITPSEDVRGLENRVSFYRVPGGWKAIPWGDGDFIGDTNRHKPKHAPAYRVSVIPPLLRAPHKTLLRESLQDAPVEHQPYSPLNVGRVKGVGRTSFKWERKHTVANESEGLLVLTVACLDASDAEKYFIYLEDIENGTKFVDASDNKKDFVEEVVSEWSKHGNVKFHFVDPDEPHDIPVRFQVEVNKEGQELIGGSSLVGTAFYTQRKAVDDGRRRLEQRRTLNLSFPSDADVHINNPDQYKPYLDEYRGIILHEFGHALGFVHEQQNPELFKIYPNFEWNLSVLIAHYTGEDPNDIDIGNLRWNQTLRSIDQSRLTDKQKTALEDVEINYLAYSDSRVKFLKRGLSLETTAYDEKSIMLYSITPAMNNVNFESKSYSELSGTDQDFIEQVYGAPQPAIKLEGHVSIEGKIYEDTRNLKRFFGGESWKEREVNKKESITAFVGSGKSAVKIKFRMHDNSKRTFALYLGSVRRKPVNTTSADISIAYGAGFLNFDVDKLAKEKGFYGFTPCERISLKLETPVSDTFDTVADNTGGGIEGFLSKVGKGIGTAIVIPVALVAAPFIHLSGVDLLNLPSIYWEATDVEAACNLNDDISLDLSPTDVIRVYDGAADQVEVSIMLTASLLQTKDTAGFEAEFNTPTAPSVAVTAPDPTIPQITSLLPNYPNPFNPETWIPYHLANPAPVTLTIYAIDGKVVRHLDLGHQTAGFYQSKSHAAYWDGRNTIGERVASGIYFYTLTAGEFAATQKMLILK